MSDAKNFSKLLYRSVVPEKKAEPEPEATPPVIAESWESYRHYPGKAAIPPYRIHEQYNAPLQPLGSAAKYMSRQFNAYCSEAGVQCTVTMDPNDFQQLYHFQNLGDRLLRIEYNGGEFTYLEPKEKTTIKVRYSLGRADASIPRVTALNNGNPDV